MVQGSTLVQTNLDFDFTQNHKNFLVANIGMNFNKKNEISKFKKRNKKVKLTTK